VTQREGIAAFKSLVLQLNDRARGVGESGNEAVFVERLAERWNTRREAIPQELIAVARDQHERDMTARRPHLFAQLQPVHAWQPDVQDEAVNIVAVPDELFSGREEANFMAHRAKKAVQRDPYVDVVIDDGAGHGGGV
jgi:pimeloyl-ACP methyl ester carboxylesterase